VRRIVYAVAGILAVNLAVMTYLWVQMQDDQCDTEKRGLVVENHRGGWDTVTVGADPDPDLGPCRGSIDLTVSSE
jgi:hypothetical protein